MRLSKGPLYASCNRKVLLLANRGLVRHATRISMCSNNVLSVQTCESNVKGAGMVSLVVPRSRVSPVLVMRYAPDARLPLGTCFNGC